MDASRLFSLLAKAQPFGDSNKRTVCLGNLGSALWGGTEILDSFPTKESKIFAPPPLYSVRSVINLEPTLSKGKFFLMTL